MSLSWKSISLSQPRTSVNFQTIVAKMRLPQGLCPGPPGGGAYSAPTPQPEKVGSHTTLDHPVEKSFPRHLLMSPIEITQQCEENVHDRPR